MRILHCAGLVGLLAFVPQVSPAEGVPDLLPQEAPRSLAAQVEEIPEGEVDRGQPSPAELLPEASSGPSPAGKMYPAPGGSAPFLVVASGWADGSPPAAPAPPPDRRWVPWTLLALMLLVIALAFDRVRAGKRSDPS